jgi:hypothetical protein
LSCRMELVIRCLNFVKNFIFAERNSAELSLHYVYFHGELRSVEPYVFGQTRDGFKRECLGKMQLSV